MGGDSQFTGGGGTFRDPLTEPKAIHPLLTDHFGAADQTLGQMYGFNGDDPKKIYDMEALKRLLELLNQSNASKPYGIPDNANIGF